MATPRKPPELHKPGGRPRLDGLPPQPRIPLPPGLDPATNIMLVRIRHLAGRGVPIPDIAALVNVAVEDLQLGGKYHREIRIGKAEGVAQIAEALYQKALGGKTIEGLFWMKCNAGWSETAAGRLKNKQADDEEDAIGGIEIEVVE